MNSNVVILGILGTIGVGLLGGGIYSVWHTRKFLQTAISADGLVTENVKRGFRRHNTTDWTYYARVSFRTREGQSVVFTSKSGNGSPAYRRNQRVPIVYDPQQPHHAFIRSELWYASTFLLGLGTFFSAPVIAFLVWRAPRLSRT